MRILVVGGAGYIGSVTVAELLAAGHEVVVFDSLVTGHAEAVSPGAELVVGDLADRDLLDDVFGRRTFDGVVYYAGFIAAGESMHDPGATSSTTSAHVINLLNAMVDHGVLRFVFSSSAGVYGEPDDGAHRRGRAACARQPLRRVEGDGGAAAPLVRQPVRPALRLAPLLQRRRRDGEASEKTTGRRRTSSRSCWRSRWASAGLEIYGTDYPTPDGTCIRDYVHVSDLAQAHFLALERREKGSAVYNLGNGQGLLQPRGDRDGAPRHGPSDSRARGATPRGRPGRPRGQRRRRPKRSWAGSRASPIWSKIIESAWRWHQAHPNGYEASGGKRRAVRRKVAPLSRHASN